MRTRSCPMILYCSWLADESTTVTNTFKKWKIRHRRHKASVPYERTDIQMPDVHDPQHHSMWLVSGEISAHLSTPWDYHKKLLLDAILNLLGRLKGLFYPHFLMTLEILLNLNVVSLTFLYLSINHRLNSALPNLALAQIIITDAPHKNSVC